MNSGIYALVERESGKKYVGRTKNLHKRQLTHFWALRNNRHPNSHLQNAWNQGQRFDFVVLEQCEPEMLNEREVYWISYYNTFSKGGYNQCEGGKTTDGYHFTEEAKAKIAKAQTGKRHTAETIAKRSQSLKQHKESDPVFAQQLHEKLSKRSQGNTWNKGRKCPEEMKKHLSEKLKGRYISPEHKEKLRMLYSGEKSLAAKLTEYDVVTIRYRFLTGERQADIAKSFPSVTPQTIYDIVHGRRWQSVPMELEALRNMLKGGTDEKRNTVA